MSTKRGTLIAGLALLCAGAFTSGSALAAGKARHARTPAAKTETAKPADKADAAKPEAKPETAKVTPAPEPSPEKMKEMMRHPEARRGHGHF